MRSVLWVAGFVALCFAVGAVWVLDPRPASLIADYWWLGNSLLFAGGFLVAWRFDRGKLVLWGGFLSVGAAAGAAIWWRLWMNSGWPGTPRLLHCLLRVDGESSYNATYIEMLLILFVVLLATVILGALTLKWSGRAQSGAPLT